MTDQNEGLKDISAESAMGMVDGNIKMLSPEQYAQQLATRNAEESYDLDETDDDLSDLDDLEALLEEDDHL